MGKLKIIVIAAVMAVFTFQGVSHAFSISAGGSVWYNRWKPAWSDGKFQYISTSAQTMLQDARFPGMSASSAFLYGPLVSVRFLDKFLLSSTFMYGKFKYSRHGLGTDTIYDFTTQSITPQILGVAYSRNVKRWDSDNTLSYRITELFSLFLGLKAQGYDYYESWCNAEPLLVFKFKSSIANYGPGLGLAVTLPVVKDVYLLANGSLIALYGTEKTRFDRGIATTAAGATFLNFKRGRYVAYGGTASASLAYVWSALNTTLNLGFRYQGLRYRQRRSEVGLDKFNGKSDSYYGLTFSAVYNINFQSEKAGP